MKTRDLIDILRCPGDHRAACEKCNSLDACKELAGLDLYNVCADRLEALLENLRQTEVELKETRRHTQNLEKRYERFLCDMTGVIHEQEILSGFGGH